MLGKKLLSTSFLTSQLQRPEEPSSLSTSAEWESKKPEDILQDMRAAMAAFENQPALPEEVYANQSTLTEIKTAAQIKNQFVASTPEGMFRFMGLPMLVSNILPTNILAVKMSDGSFRLYDMKTGRWFELGNSEAYDFKK